MFLECRYHFVTSVPSTQAFIGKKKAWEPNKHVFLINTLHTYLSGRYKTSLDHESPIFVRPEWNTVKRSRKLGRNDPELIRSTAKVDIG